jgi:hypothetical protein
MDIIAEASPETLTFVDVLRIEVATLQARHPEHLGAYARAHAAIIEGHVVPLADGEGKVLSDDKHTWYRTNGTCTCDAGHFHKPCKHLAAWRLYTHVAAKYAEVTGQDTTGAETPEEAKLQIPSHYLVWIQGVKCIRLVGLIHIAHERGMRELRADFTYNDDNLSLAHAVAIFPPNAWFPDGGHFEESGDSTPTNAKRVGEHWRRMSLARAKARTLRDALALDMVSVEEME